MCVRGGRVVSISGLDFKLLALAVGMIGSQTSQCIPLLWKIILYTWRGRERLQSKKSWWVCLRGGGVVFRFRFTVRGADTSSAKDATPNLSRRSVPLAAREFN